MPRAAFEMGLPRLQPRRVVSFQVEHSLDVFRPREVGLESAVDLLERAVTMRNKRLDQDLAGGDEFERAAISRRANVRVEPAGGADRGDERRLEKQNVSPQANVASLVAVPVKQDRRLFPEQAGHLLEDGGVPSGFDQIMNPLAMRQLANGFAEVRLMGAYGRPAEPPSQLQVLFANVAHEDEAFKILDVAQVL